MEIKFTKSCLEELPYSLKGKRTDYKDSQTTYLSLRVSHNSKSFYYYRKLQGRKSPIRDKIGEFPETTIYQAREKIKQINNQILTGEYFTRSTMLFSELFDKYYKNYSSQHKRTHKEDIRNYNFHLKRFHNRSISDITKPDILQFHNDIGENNGKYIANRMLVLMKGIFSWGIKNEIIKITNPASGIKLFKEQSRERFLDDQELQIFFKVLDSTTRISETFRDYFKVLLFCGQRRSNVAAMRFKDIDFSTKQWYIPGEIFKNGDQFYAILVDYVINIITVRRGKCPDSEFVFSSVKSKSGHIEEPRKAWDTLLKEAGVENLHIHDLRRTIGSWMAKGGDSLKLIGEGLGQKTTAATEVYTRFKKQTVRTSFDNATNAMLNAINKNDHSGLSDIEKLKNKILAIKADSIEEFKKKNFELLL